jgi:hypothetical protein
MPIYGHSNYRYGLPVTDKTIKDGIYTGNYIADPEGNGCVWEYLDSSNVPKYEPGPMPEDIEPKRRVLHD